MDTTVTIRVDRETHAKLRTIAAEEQTSIGAVVRHAIDGCETRRSWAQTEAAFARLAADPEAMAGYQAEVRAFDGTLQDGLEVDPWTGDGPAP